MPTKPVAKLTTSVQAKLRADPDALRRNRPVKDDDEELARPPASVSAGSVDKVIDLAFNPTREKIREVTIIDRMQGRLFPQLDMINAGRHYLLEIAMHRQDPEAYEKKFKQKRPVSPDLLDELLFRTAQWQKSVLGKNLDRATDIALAETETKTEEDMGGGGGSGDPWKE